MDIDDTPPFLGACLWGKAPDVVKVSFSILPEKNEKTKNKS
jgi:hypothetical protein